MDAVNKTSPTGADKRAHERIDSGFLMRHMEVTLTGSVPTRVRNLSYGGIAFDIAPVGTPLNGGEEAQGILTYKNIVMPIKVKIVRNAGGIYGTRFALEDYKALKTLKMIIECYFRGRSLLKIDPSHYNDFATSKPEHYLRGDGPTDILLRRDNISGAVIATITMAKECLEIHGDKFSTSAIGAGRYVGGDVQSHREMDILIVHRAMITLAGAMDTEHRALVAPVLEQIIGKIGATSLAKAS